MAAFRAVAALGEAPGARKVPWRTTFVTRGRAPWRSWHERCPRSQPDPSLDALLTFARGTQPPRAELAQTGHTIGTPRRTRVTPRRRHSIACPATITQRPRSAAS